MHAFFVCGIPIKTWIFFIVLLYALDRKNYFFCGFKQPSIFLIPWIFCLEQTALFIFLMSNKFMFRSVQMNTEFGGGDLNLNADLDRISGLYFTKRTLHLKFRRLSISTLAEVSCFCKHIIWINWQRQKERENERRIDKNKEGKRGGEGEI